MTIITIECCGGLEKYSGHCLKERCPNYKTASYEVERSWPRLPTGVRDTQGHPTHTNNLNKVRKNLSIK